MPSIEEINTLRRKIVHEGYEPSDGELREAFMAIREQRTGAAESSTKKSTSKAKAAQPLDLDALMKGDLKL